MPNIVEDDVDTPSPIMPPGSVPQAADAHHYPGQLPMQPGQQQHSSRRRCRGQAFCRRRRTSRRILYQNPQQPISAGPARRPGIWRAPRILAGQAEAIGKAAASAVEIVAIMSGSPLVRSGEYAERGDYHREPDPSWDYYPTYIAKLDAVRRGSTRLPAARACSTPAAAKACSSTSTPAGWRIEGVDPNYSSARVRLGSLTALPYADGASIARYASTCSST